MERLRKPLQGTRNIIRFNWHFYLLAAGAILLIYFLNHFLDKPFRVFGNALCVVLIGTTFISLLVSIYVYDFSGLYQLKGLDLTSVDTHPKIINVHAGFDETSQLLSLKYPNADLQVFDFYDPEKHTEVSIKRARKAYPPYPGTKVINTSSLPLVDNYADGIFVTLSAHEIRNEDERATFFIELKRVLKHPGSIVVTEHIRDWPNFLAYNIGFFHFIPKASWYDTFKRSQLIVSKEVKITPFITTFILEKYGTAP